MARGEGWVRVWKRNAGHDAGVVKGRRQRIPFVDHRHAPPGGRPFRALWRYTPSVSAPPPLSPELRPAGQRGVRGPLRAGCEWRRGPRTRSAAVADGRAGAGRKAGTGACPAGAGGAASRLDDPFEGVAFAAATGGGPCFSAPRACAPSLRPIARAGALRGGPAPPIVPACRRRWLRDGGWRRGRGAARVLPRPGARGSAAVIVARDRAVLADAPRRAPGREARAARRVARVRRRPPHDQRAPAQPRAAR